MIIKAWFVWMLLSNGSEGIYPVGFETLDECLKFESTITTQAVETKCFYGTVKAPK